MKMKEFAQFTVACIIGAVHEFFRPITDLFSADAGDPTMMDHVAVPKQKSSAAKRLAKARALAQQRHGKPFLCDQKVARDTDPSRNLQELNDKSQAKPETNVVALGNRS